MADTRRQTLFRVALAILKLNEPDIIACQSVSDLLVLLGGTTSRLWAADKLIAVSHPSYIKICYLNCANP